LAGSRVVAVLGPTNTGKTYLAIERMLGHRTGMIGFPLRLLARENYDRVRAIKGDGLVALVTGEEKIVPPSARYFFCTVESMPLEREVAFLAIDEVQLCADRERGHIFTDRLLHARGRDETMLLGAETMTPLIAKLVPEAEFVARPRFSQLTYAGPKKITRLPPRSAIVAFSAAEVYSIAELVRRQRGGAAVVLGALSPRTRNAQVAMFQAGEVDYLVATDAIGMGLNMDVNHVAFAALRKFDGHHMRNLSPAELAQIAGRAGRHMNDGTFGTTNEVGSLEPHVVDAIESHRFSNVKAVYWRNSELDFRSLGNLLRSLDAPADLPELMRKRDAMDQLVLAQFAEDKEIAPLANSPARLRVLWEDCQIPDFRKELSESHSRLLGQIFRYLVAPEGRLPEDWVARQIARLDRTEGDIDTLVARIDHVRTWTYVSHREDWLADAAQWREATRAIEDKLSDALHERLTQRFVDRRTALLVKKLKDPGALLSSVTEDGGVAVEGHYVGQLDGFRFHPDQAANDPSNSRANRALLNAAGRALRQEIGRRVRAFTDAADEAFAVDDEGRIAWRGDPVARLAAGRDALTPEIELLPSDLLEPEQQAALRRRLAQWLADRISADLAPLLALRDACAQPDVSGPLRGILFQLSESLGAVARRDVAPQVAALDGPSRKQLARLGVRLGVLHLFCPALFRPRAIRRRALLWRIHGGADAVFDPPKALLRGKPVVVLQPDSALSADQARVLGYTILGPRALRLDQAERLAAETRKLARQGPFAVTAALSDLAGAQGEDLVRLLEALGYRVKADAMGEQFVPRKPAHREGQREGQRSPPKTGTTAERKRARGKPREGAHAPSRATERPRRPPRSSDSPFAKLGEMLQARRREQGSS
jgi:ATP-dependent RNA helicase SUPV3L1/SUV3